MTQESRLSFFLIGLKKKTSDIVEGQRNYKSKRKSEKNVQAWPRTCSKLVPRTSGIY